MDAMLARIALIVESVSWAVFLRGVEVEEDFVALGLRT
jgi:hypothetical protein